MWKDIEAGGDTSKRKLDDLFHAEAVFDSSRPTPVEWKMCIRDRVNPVQNLIVVVRIFKADMVKPDFPFYVL